MIKNIIIAVLTILCVLAFIFAAYQKAEAERTLEETKRQAGLAKELRFQVVKMEAQLDSIKRLTNKTRESN